MLVQLHGTCQGISREILEVLFVKSQTIREYDGFKGISRGNGCGGCLNWDGLDWRMGEDGRRAVLSPGSGWTADVRG